MAGNVRSVGWWLIALVVMACGAPAVQPRPPSVVVTPPSAPAAPAPTPVSRPIRAGDWVFARELVHTRECTKITPWKMQEYPVYHFCARLHPGARVRVHAVRAEQIDVVLWDAPNGAHMVGAVAPAMVQHAERPLDTAAAHTGELGWGSPMELNAVPSWAHHFGGSSKCGYFVRSQHGEVDKDGSAWFRVSQLWDNGVELTGFAHQDVEHDMLEPVGCSQGRFYDEQEYQALLREGGTALRTGNEALARQALKLFRTEPIYSVRSMGDRVACVQLEAELGKQDVGLCERTSDDHKGCDSYYVGDAGLWTSIYGRHRHESGKWSTIVFRCGEYLHHVVAIDAHAIDLVNLANSAGPEVVAAAVSEGATWRLYRSSEACQAAAASFNALLERPQATAAVQLALPTSVAPGC